MALANPQKKTDDDTEAGPSIDSESQEERIAARRSRIHKRIEAAKRAELGGILDEQEIIESEPTKSRKQMETSRFRLQKLLEDGSELVTNIRVAIDCREQLRRREEEEALQQRMDNQERDAKAGQEKFDEITKKWESALQKEIPQDLWEMWSQQRTSCDAMIEDKNKIIRDLETELRMRSDQYVRDLKKQSDDVELIAERMDEQIRTMNRAYREELLRIETAFLEQRVDALKSCSDKWAERTDLRRRMEQEYMEIRQKKVDEYATELHQLQVRDAEEYNNVKRRLESDVMVLEQQYQQMKATYQLNQEKLEYNFQVLKKRDDENTHTIGEQKRRITKLQDAVNNLRIKMRKQEQLYNDDNQQLTNDYKKVVDQLRHLQKKSKHLLMSDEEKFREVWLMEEEEAQRLAKRLLEMDKLIFEQQLGLDYQSSRDDGLQFLNNRGPLNDVAHNVEQSAMAVATRLLSHTDTSGERADSAQMRRIEKAHDEAISSDTIRRVLQLLADESGFLVEEKLNNLLAPLEKDEKNLMMLDSIFSALGISTEKDVRSLAKHFVRFIRTSSETQSRQMTDVLEGDGGSAADGAAGAEDAAGDGQGEGARWTAGGAGGGQSSKSVSFIDQKAGSSSVDKAGVDKDSDKERAKAESKAKEHGLLGLTTRPSSSSTSDHRPSTAASDPSIHFLTTLIHPNEVYAALRDFVQQHRAKASRGRDMTDFSSFKVAELSARDTSGDTAYWQQYHSVIAECRQRLWDGIAHGLERYYEVLQLRDKLLRDNDLVRRQNGELRLLLQQYITSKVNAELKVPPTRYMQLDAKISDRQPPNT